MFSKTVIGEGNVTTKKQWSNISNLIRITRRNRRISQEHLSVSLGYKNAQMISNVERGLAGIPVHTVPTLCEVLGLKEEVVISNMVSDYRMHLLESIKQSNLRTIFTPTGKSKTIVTSYPQ